ncbi:helix-turn-helix domain-containing protein [Streptomyces sp. W16]|uniref:helix-turn-helix domain-containing protein n=1 Tax=Streptomyces sp. W16 TaxID=3076631 RepID=UPI00295B2A36|nr:helix-turn-helix domain-containing protein [Streptomyces sp. W16]MDV9168548.1 helix-turn-helix domain-containing protein [Streptomyces sp. W16]
MAHRTRSAAIADELRCSQKTVRRWLHCFNCLGLDGLEDLGGQGRKRRNAQGSSAWSSRRRWVD